MLSHTTNKKQAEKFVIIQKENSIYYKLNDAKELKAIEVSKDLYRVKFYYSEVKSEKEEIGCALTEEQLRVRGIVSSSVYPPSPEIGHVMTDSQGIEIYGMNSYSLMPACNREYIAKYYCILEQLHPLEWILTKSRNSKVLPNELYERIRIDVRHRAKQLQIAAKINKDSYQKVLDEIRKKYVPNPNFKRITSSYDTCEFAGHIVAFLSNLYYFSSGNGALTFPVEVSGQKVRFARVNTVPIKWQGGEIGYDMDLFKKLEHCGSTHALIDSQIKHDSAFAMRLASVQELEFLKLTLECDQGELNFRNKDKDIKMLDSKIAQAAGVGDASASSRFSFFTPRKGVVIPPFKTFTSGVVDWSREKENKDKSNPPKPDKVYLVKGGDEKSRYQRAYELAREDAFAMHAVYSNKDKSEYAVVFACDHDTFNLMNFDAAKNLAGQKQLPENFHTSTFGKEARFGVINIKVVNDTPKESPSSFGCSIM